MLRYMGLLPTQLDNQGKYDWSQKTFGFDKEVWASYRNRAKESEGERRVLCVVCVPSLCGRRGLTRAERQSVSCYPCFPYPTASRQAVGGGEERLMWQSQNLSNPWSFVHKSGPFLREVGFDSNSSGYEQSP